MQRYENVYNYSRSYNISFFNLYKAIYEKARNMNSLNEAIREARLVIEQIPENSEAIDEIPLDIAVIDDWINIAASEELRKFKGFDWATEAIGSFFIKNLKYYWTYCQLTITSNNVMKLVNDLFTLPKQNLSLPNIALIYTLNNHKVIDSSNHIEGNSQLSDYLKDCLRDVRNKSTFKKEPEYFGFGTRYSIHKDNQYSEPSPCQNLEKFSTCSKYCIWHKHFFGDIMKSEFLTSMTYAMPQRKIR